jgi:hypothetical protein
MGAVSQGDGAKEIPGKGKPENPESRPQHIVSDKPAVAHLSHAGKEWGKRPYEGNEPGDPKKGMGRLQKR